MIFVTDLAGMCTHVGREWSILTGQPIADALGRGWLDRIVPEDRTIVADLAADAAAQRAEFSMRYRLMTVGRSVVWVVAGGMPSFGPPDDTFLGYLGSVTVIADETAGVMTAFGSIGRFVPPPRAAPPVEDNLDQIADHLLIAHALIDANGGKEALPTLKATLFTIGCALARRQALRRPLN